MESTPTTDGPRQPGDNPNARNARSRQNVRPRTKNNAPKSQNSMRMAWLDPLPQVDASMALGLEHNPEVIPAGTIELNLNLPENISAPFVDLVESVGDRIQLDDDVKINCGYAIKALSYFKAARQLYSTMLDHEKSWNQPLKAIFYDDTPIPVHMSGALGIIGHIESKVGKVVIQNASTLFKRWICLGLQNSPGLDDYEEKRNSKGALIEPLPDVGEFVWLDQDGHNMVQRLARERISQLVNQTYRITVGDDIFTVSMPNLTDQPLDEYYGFINNDVPHHATLKDLVALLDMNLSGFKSRAIGHGRDFERALQRLNLCIPPEEYSVQNLRSSFEEWIATYTVEYRPRVDSILKTGPAPTGTTGYGAQTVSSTDNVARWKFPLSDADVNIGYLFSPMKSFSLEPRLVGYSNRHKHAAAAHFAQQDGKAFV